MPITLNKPTGELKRTMTPSDMLSELHIYILPWNKWIPFRRLAKNHVVEETVSAGFVRVTPTLTLDQLRQLLRQELPNEIPEHFVYVKSVGRNFTQVRKVQEQVMKVKNFVPPLATDPEIHLLELSESIIRSYGSISNLLPSDTEYSDTNSLSSTTIASYHKNSYSSKNLEDIPDASPFHNGRHIPERKTGDKNSGENVNSIPKGRSKGLSDNETSFTESLDFQKQPNIDTSLDESMQSLNNIKTRRKSLKTRSQIDRRSKSSDIPPNKLIKKMDTSNKSDAEPEKIVSNSTISILSTTSDDSVTEIAQVSDKVKESKSSDALSEKKNCLFEKNTHKKKYWKKSPSSDRLLHSNQASTEHGKGSVIKPLTEENLKKHSIQNAKVNSTTTRKKISLNNVEIGNDNFQTKTKSENSKSHEIPKDAQKHIRHDKKELKKLEKSTKGSEPLKLSNGDLEQSSNKELQINSQNKTITKETKSPIDTKGRPKQQTKKIDGSKSVTENGSLSSNTKKSHWSQKKRDESTPLEKAQFVNDIQKGKTDDAITKIKDTAQILDLSHNLNSNTIKYNTSHGLSKSLNSSKNGPILNSNSVMARSVSEDSVVALNTEERDTNGDQKRSSRNRGGERSTSQRATRRTASEDRNGYAPHRWAIERETRRMEKATKHKVQVMLEEEMVLREALKAVEFKKFETQMKKEEEFDKLKLSDRSNDQINAMLIEAKLKEVMDDKTKHEGNRTRLFAQARALHEEILVLKEKRRLFWFDKFNVAMNQGKKLEDRQANLRQEMESFYARVVGHLRRKLPLVTGVKDEPSRKASYKISAIRLRHEIADLQRRVEAMDIKLKTETRLRQQAEKEVKQLREEVNRKKANFSLTLSKSPSLRDTYFLDDFF